MTANSDRSRQVQLGLLPKAPVLPGVQIATHYEPVDMVGGDFYDFLSFPPNRLGIVIADVSGHGVDAAIIMATAKKSLQLIARNATSPREVLIALGAELAGDIPDKAFISVFFGILDMREGTLTYASAGHNPPLMVRRGGAEELPGRGTVISRTLLDHLGRTLQEFTVPFSRGDTLLLYTDGIVEAAGADDEDYGIDRLKQRAVAGAQDECRRVLESIWTDVRSHVGERGMADDATLLAVRLREMMLTPAPVASSRGPRKLSNIPPADMPFVGREEALASLNKWLTEQGNLMVVSGTAGAGKTALAQEFGRQAVSNLAFGAWFVDLTQCSDPRDAMREILSVLGAAPRGAEPLVRSVADALAMRGPMLLILDGLRDPLGLLADAIPQWVKAQPEIRFLMTTRRRARFIGAQELALAPLSYPGRAARRTGPVEDLQHFEAVQFFVHAALEHVPDFDPGEAELRQVAAICEALEGHPISLQLAAARLSSLSLEALVGQLKTTSRKLAALQEPGGKESSAVLSSLRDSIDWSLQALSDFELAALNQLCIFPDGFFLEAAQEVVSLELHPGSPPLSAILGTLAERGLIDCRPVSLGNRWRVYAPVMDTLRSRTDWGFGSGDPENPVRRFIRYFTSLSYTIAMDTTGRHAAQWRERAGLERASMAHAFKLAQKSNDRDASAMLMVALAPGLLRSGRGEEAQRLFADYLTNLPDKRISPEAEAVICMALARVQGWIADHGSAGESLTRAGRAAARSKDRLFRGTVAVVEAEHLMVAKRIEPAAERLDYATFMFQRGGDATRMDQLETARGRLMLAQGRVTDAISILLPAAERLRRAGLTRDAHHAESMAATALLNIERNEEALAVLNRLLAEMAHEEGSDTEAIARHNHSLVLMNLGRFEEALESLDSAEEVIRMVGRQEGLAWISTARARLHMLLGETELAHSLLAVGLDVARKVQSATAITSVYYLRVLLAALERNFAAVQSEMDGLRRECPISVGSRSGVDLPLVELWAQAESGKPTDPGPLLAEMAKYTTGKEEAPLRLLAQAVVARRAELAGDKPARDTAVAAARAEVDAFNLGPYDPHLLTQMGLELLEEVQGRASAPEPGPDGAVTGKLLHAREHSLRFACRCGAEYTVKTNRAGKATSCPKCKTRLLVPRPA
ncbi:MAG: SpoIIE family protein phosphatase [Planctomycetes bacterium]|nr:SpoIIE family protein phosphatase [Planctomycetota bacterium]